MIIILFQQAIVNPNMVSHPGFQLLFGLYVVLDSSSIPLLHLPVSCFVPRHKKEGAYPAAFCQPDILLLFTVFALFPSFYRLSAVLCLINCLTDIRAHIFVIKADPLCRFVSLCARLL